MLPKDVELVMQANARMATELLEIEGVVRGFCPTENSEPDTFWEGPNPEPRAKFICCNEDADLIIEAESLADAIVGAHACWESMAKANEQLQTKLTAAETALAAAQRDGATTAACDHNWISGSNAFTMGNDMCSKCLSWQPAATNATTGEAQSGEIPK